MKRKDDSAPVAGAVASSDELRQARTRARRRLIGAAVLLAIGIVGFPLVFDTQPRPIPVDIKIEIPSKDNVPPLAAPASRAEAARADVAKVDAQGVVTEAPAAAEPPPKPVPAPASAVASVPAKPATPAMKTPPKPEAKPGPEAKNQAADAARARALLEGKTASVDKAGKTDKPEPAGRYVVQVGAFADAGAARDMRSKVERLGLKTFTQVVDTDNGKRTRVRVGPFASKEEADKAAGRINAAGLQSSVLSM